MTDTLTRPAHLWVPPHESTAAVEVIEFVEQAGLRPFPEQRLALEALLAEKPDGKWATLEQTLICGRQNLKTYVFKAIALADLFLFDARLVVWTAHLYSTTAEAMRDLEEIIAGVPEFTSRVKRISHENGEECIELHGDQRIAFRARSKYGGRGLTGDRVILDEAWALGAAEIGSLIPLLSTVPNPSVMYGSSAGLIGSEFLRTLRDRGRAGNDPSLIYVEWCAPDTPCEQDKCDHRLGAEGCALDNEELWRAANPALGRRITVDFVRSERRTMPPEEFARERLGWWDEPVTGNSGILDTDWAVCADRDAGVGDTVAVGIDVSPGHRSAALVVHGESLHVVDHHQGTQWLIPRLVELKASKTFLGVALDPSGPVGALIADLEKAGLLDDLRLLDSREQTQACEGFLSATVDHSLTHRDQHVLNVAVKGAGRRVVGDSWKWSRRDSDVDISPLVAATVARFVWAQAPKPAPAKVWAAWR